MYNFEDFVIDKDCLPDNYYEFAFTKDKIKKISTRTPIIFLPPILAADEIFRPITGVVVRNIIPNRYYVSNYGRLWDGFTNRFIALHFSEPYDANGYNPGYIKSKVSYYSDPYNIKSIDILLHRIVMLVFGYFPWL